jgi:arylsulfatase
MRDLMFAEFAKYQVLPLDASVATRMVTPRPSMSGGRKEFVYSGVPVVGMPRGTAPNLLNTSYTIDAEIEVLQGGAEGVIVTDGGRFGGYGLYLLHGKPMFLWNLLNLKRVRWEGAEPLAPGKDTLEYDFKYVGLGFATLAFNNISGLGRPRVGTLKVDGNVVSTQELDHTVPLTCPGTTQRFRRSATLAPRFSRGDRRRLSGRSFVPQSNPCSDGVNRHRLKGRAMAPDTDRAADR